MTEFVPVDILQGWITELQSLLKQDSQKVETGSNPLFYQGMQHGIAQIQSRLTTWLQHQENMDSLTRSGKKFLITKDINLSDGRYRNLEWYQGGQFVVLAWRHAKDAEAGELMLEIQETGDLSTEYLVYHGGSSFDTLAGLTRENGMEAIRNEENRQEWMEKVWT